MFIFSGGNNMTKKIIGIVLTLAVIFSTVSSAFTVTASAQTTASNSVVMTSSDGTNGGNAVFNKTGNGIVFNSYLFDKTKTVADYMGSAWTLNNLATTSNSSYKILFNGVITSGNSPSGSVPSKLVDSTFTTWQEIQLGHTTAWNPLSGTGFPHLREKINGTNYYVPTYKGNSTGNEMTIDYVTDLGSEMDFKGLFVTPANEKWALGGYEIYVSNDKDNLFNGTPIATYQVDRAFLFNFTNANEPIPAALKNNSVNTWKVPYGTNYTGRYVGFRITQLCNSMTTAANGGHITSTIRLNELLVYAEPKGQHTHIYDGYTAASKTNPDNHTIACSCGATLKTEAHNFTKNIDTGIESCPCGYERHFHDFKTYKYTDEQHWLQCVCGEKDSIANHEVETDAKFGDICKTCGYIDDDILSVASLGTYNEYTNPDKVGFNYRNSIIANKGLVSATYINTYKGITTPTAITDNTKDYINRNDGMTADHQPNDGRIGNAWAEDHKYNFYENGTEIDNEDEIHVDLVFDAGNTKFSQVAYCGLKQKETDSTLYHYKWSFANKPEDLFTANAVATTGDLYNTKANQYMAYSFKKEVIARYVGLRIIKSYQLNTQHKQYNYISIGNISVFGEHSCTYNTPGFDYTNHWLQCTCGKIDESTVVPHTYSTDSTTGFKVCSDCDVINKGNDDFDYNTHRISQAQYANMYDLSNSLIYGKDAMVRFMNKDINDGAYTKPNGSTWCAWNTIRLTGDEPKAIDLGHEGSQKWGIFGIYENGRLVDIKQDENQLYIDLKYSLGGQATIDKMTVYGHSSNILSIYKFRVSFANTPDELFTSDAILTSDIMENLDAAFDISPKEDIKARYVGLRVISAVTPEIYDSTSSVLTNETASYLRIANISVFGTRTELKEDKILKLEAAGPDNMDYVKGKAGIDFKKSVIAGKDYVEAVYINRFMKLNTPTIATDPDIKNINGTKYINGQDANGPITTDSGSHRIGNNPSDDKKYWFYNDDVGFIDDEGLMYFQVTYDIGYIAKLEKLGLAMANNDVRAAMSHFKFSFANKPEDLFTDNAITTGEIYNPDANTYMVYSFAEEVKAKYVSLRVICPHQLDKGAFQYFYINLGNISVFGDYACGGTHVWEHDPIRASTCTLDGMYNSTCKECWVEKRSNLPALGHKYENYDQIIPADCTNNEKHVAVCENEGCTTTHAIEIPNTATGHNFINTPTVVPYGKQAGRIGGTHCSKCSEIKKAGTTIYAIKSVELSTTKYQYDGEAKKPSVTVKDINGKKVSSSLYKVKYAEGRKNIGKYKVTVTFKDDYAPQQVAEFTIAPKKTSIKSITAGSKKFTVKWSKVTTKNKGYEIQYSTSSKFSNAKTVTISKNSTTSKTIKSLKAKKTYYVRIRTYTTVDGVKYASGWCTKKSIKTK